MSKVPFITKANTENNESERTRTRILDAAAHVLSSKGYAGTRMTDIAESADIAPVAIYDHFQTRDDLIEEVMYRGISDMRQRLQQALDALPPGASPMDRIMVAVEAHLRNELQLSDYCTASIRNSGQLPEKLSKRQKKEEAAYGQLWQSLFYDAAAAGQVDPELDVALAMLLSLGALNWVAEWWDPRRGSVDDIVAKAQLILRRGLTSNSDPSASREGAVKPGSRWRLFGRSQPRVPARRRS
ncbi:TetR family transcriptional regulator [Mycobacterium kiyosense]|uniref:TetR family transcriptional regulator n=1 Tax=Mycobacterium kiyosense TaxID=2871094 RepID=A0A9P3UXV3_9MYCO|nr:MULTISPECIES: TetR/AcrR family transcriptional regulator [Mycobacterium]BDB44286.1 TetR family transcriptional regulator [Mycobacterium kiyosense]BDE15818.1 TetR family transcriptional regulator [Mycobacterium sp. 20KCMC460]GLB80788.1 TetR family transcriptional regulator [Mycobacterium kiyosense]GLB87474.1 TetR family transcriptional regulator [Mycobacterium kiyosense]GLB93268.1 TetR family transcriptional regulator [Mycobacterium kiyosense]